MVQQAHSHQCQGLLQMPGDAAVVLAGFGIAAGMVVAHHHRRGVVRQRPAHQQVAATVEFVRERRVPAVFCESTVSPEAQEQVAREAGSRFAGVLYVDSLSAADGPVPSYLELLRRDARTVAAGLTGTSPAR